MRKNLNLFLFDLDGTLVTTGGAGLRALDKTFKALYGLEGVLNTVDPSGKTDPAIFREILNHFQGRDMTEEERAVISETYLGHLAYEIESTKPTRPLPGILEFLDCVSERMDILLALGTGNLERGARIKLSPTPLNGYFPLGGFGSDAEERASVLLRGRQRAEAFCGQPIPASAVYVIGDTPLDVKAARRAGFKAVAVASGTISYNALRETNPDLLLKDMTEGHKLLSEIEI